MDFEQKFEAINSLDWACLRMRKPGDWYVEQSVEIKNNSILEGRYGNGSTPEEAIESHWKELTELASHEYIVINAHSDDRECVKWNGYRWKNVKEKGDK